MRAFQTLMEKKNVTDNDADELSRLGTRLEWIFPADLANPLVEMIAPLFREPEADNGAVDDGSGRAP